VCDALGLAGCGSDTISYLEAHGTATLLGDAVELTALGQVFGERPPPVPPCALGSVKTNIGHLDCVSGVAGLIKTALMLRHRQLVPSLHLVTPNPALASASSPFQVNTALREWPAGVTPRRAGVSSFGIGGTNAHVIVEEPPPPDPPGPGTVAPADEYQLLVLSARSATALERVSENLARQLREQRTTLDLADVAYTLAVGRRPHANRRALVCRDTSEAAVALMLTDQDRLIDGRVGEGGASVTFVFADRFGDSGGRAAALYRELPAFREAIDRCFATMTPSVGSDPVLLLGEGGPAATVIIQCALAGMWTAWGVRPEALVGFGVGEFAAACVAGVFGLPAALALATRGNGDPPFDFTPAAPGVPLWSAADQRWMRSSTATDPATWTRPRAAVTDPGSALATIIDHRCQVPLELWPVGPDPAMSGREALLTSAGRLWSRGVEVDWTAFFGGRPGRRVALPTYPFDRRRYWVEPAARPATVAPPPSGLLAPLRQQLEETAGADRADVVRSYLQREIAGILGLDSAHSVDPDQDLFSLGIGSLDLIAIAARLSAELQRQVPLSLLVDHPTIRVYADNVVHG
jgi:phthiocerol/phenolphthiocerol synthesis type-I polyketide synthase E